VVAFVENVKENIIVLLFCSKGNAQHAAPTGLTLPPFGQSHRSAKIVIAEKLGSRALRADAMEAITCGWLSFVVVIALAAQWAFGAWWIDGVASLAIVWLLIKEGREAWLHQECCAGGGHV
jgi:hypothetical protein